MRPLFVINPISGKGRRSKIGSLLEQRGFDYVLTSAPGEAERIAATTDADVVVAVGGDGTVNEVARGLLGPVANGNAIPRPGKVLGIIPCGSGDGLARCLGISRYTEKALDTVLNGVVQPLDVGLVNGRPFFSVCGVGLDAEVSKEFAQAGKRGVVTYLEKAVDVWKKYKPERLTIEIDGRRWTQDAVLVTVANSNQWGNDAKVAPYADCSDGVLDITVLDRFSSLELPDLAIRLMAGHCDSSSKVHCYKGNHIVISREKAGMAHFDGEWFEADKILDISILPSALKVFVPKG